MKWFVCMLLLVGVVRAQDCEMLVTADTGEIISVKKQPCEWGRMERDESHFIIVKFKDAKLSKELAALAAKGEPVPQITMPYRYVTNVLVGGALQESVKEKFRAKPAELKKLKDRDDVAEITNATCFVRADVAVPAPIEK